MRCSVAFSLHEACRDVRPTAHLLSFASPKESKQRKGDPAVCDPGAPGAPGQPAVLAGSGVGANSPCGLRQRAPLIRSPLRSSAQPEGVGESRAIASLGVGAMQLVATYAINTGATTQFDAPSCRAQRWHVGYPRPDRATQSARRADASGSPFFGYFLWRSKESRSPAGARPGL